MTPVNWYSTTINALQDLWGGFLGFIDELVGALIVFTIGWFVSLGVGKLITEVLRKLQFNELFKGGSWGRALDKSEIDTDASKFIGELFKWIVFIVFLLAVADILGLNQFSSFIREVLSYLPHVAASALIFVVAVIVADFAKKIVSTAVEGMKVAYADLAGTIAKWAIWVFAFLVILDQLKIEAVDWVVGLVQIIIAGVVFMFALAFGLGGKDVAHDILQDLRNRVGE